MQFKRRAIIWICFLLAFTASVQGQSDVSSQIQNTVAQMRRAIEMRDEKAYSRLVDWSDPVFALEHKRFVDDWVKKGARVLELGISQVVSNGSNVAVGQLRLSWENPTGRQHTDWAASFRRINNRWLYAGEHWIDVRLPQALVRIAPGFERTADAMAQVLPEVLEHVQTTFARRFKNPVQIKLYASAEAVTASVSLNAPIFGGWNEPGEALKLVARNGGLAKDTLAHEATHNIIFEGDPENVTPWWVHEGMADFVASKYNPNSVKRQLERVREWSRTNQLIDWAELSDYSTTPLEYWKFVYAQGLAMIVYIHEAYGPEKRNAWLERIAAVKDISRTSFDIFGVDFAALDQAFKLWLKR